MAEVGFVPSFEYGLFICEVTLQYLVCAVLFKYGILKSYRDRLKNALVG